jgi:hypothetical protein
MVHQWFTPTLKLQARPTQLRVANGGVVDARPSRSQKLSACRISSNGKPGRKPSNMPVAASGKPADLAPFAI